MNYSSTWKSKLKRDLRDLRRALALHYARKNKERARETLFVRLEHFIFEAAFIARKLKDSKKLSDEIETRLMLRVRKYPRRKRGRSLQDNWYDKAWIQSRYRTERLALWKVCGLLIHAIEFFTWVWVDRDDVSIVFTSDHTLAKCIHVVSLEEYLAAIEQVIDDEIGYVRFRWDERLKDHVISEKASAGSSRGASRVRQHIETMKHLHEADDLKLGPDGRHRGCSVAKEFDAAVVPRGGA